MDELQPLAGNPSRMTGEQGHQIPRRPVPTRGSAISPPAPFSADSPHPEHSFAPRRHGTHTSQPSFIQTKVPKLWGSLLKPFERGWTLEVLSCLISCAALVVIIALLATHEGRPLPQWPSVISINSLISIMTTIQKATLLLAVTEALCQLKWHHFRSPQSLIDLDRFDAASRGPWGALLLVLKLPKQFLAAIGASIIVAALAIDPFSQQVIGYDLCPRPVPEASTSVPITNNYTSFGAFVDDGNTIRSSFIDFSLVDAMYQGFANILVTDRPFLKAECYTGNCTFPSQEPTQEAYASLGMCYSYEDITNTASQITNGSDAAYTTSGGLQLARNQTLVSSIIGSTGSGRDVNGIDYIVAWDILMRQLANCTTANAESCVTSRPYAFRSALYPCMRTYKAAVAGGTLNEQTVTTTPLIYMAQGHVLATNRTLRDGVWNDCNPSSERSSSHPVAYPIDDYLVPAANNTNTEHQYYPGDCNPLAAIGPYQLQKLARNGTANAEWVNQYLSSVTNAVTASMRQGGDTPPSGYPQGIVFRTYTCPLVTWAWLSLPMLLQVLGVAFVAVVAAGSARSKSTPTWKSSELALLFHGLDQNLMEQYSHLEKVEDMADNARTIQAMLSGNARNGWHFREVHGSMPLQEASAHTDSSFQELKNISNVTDGSIRGVDSFR